MKYFIILHQFTDYNAYDVYKYHIKGDMFKYV